VAAIGSGTTAGAALRDAAATGRRVAGVAVHRVAAEPGLVRRPGAEPGWALPLDAPDAPWRCCGDAGRPRRYIAAMADRPKHQRWIKRPPRPSRAVPAAGTARTPPGMTQFGIACGFGLLAALLGAVLGPQLLPGRPGMGGLFAGLGLVIGFIAVWRGFGGTRKDVRELFR
jgi:hypothetical protein